MTLASNVCRSNCEDFAKAKFNSDEDVEVIQEWDSMGLRAELVRGIHACGYEKPTEIQQQSIKPIIKGRDVVAQAQSGTGKTVAFCIAVLQTIDTAVLETQALCLSPSRGLAIQIQKTITHLAANLGIDCHACIGGTHLGEDIRKLDYGQHIISGTPGRTFDMIHRGFLQTRSIKILVVDEVDEMFNKGFREKLYEIKSYLPSNTQFVFISTTILQEIHEMTTKFMTNPMQILIKDDGLTLDGFKQFFVAVVQEEGKFETLCDMYEILSIVQTIVFCNTKKMANGLTEKLSDAGFTVSCIHSDMSQKEQNSNLKTFRSGTSRVLISTDGSARGIDIQPVSIVVNYDLPKNRELYIRRIGRSSRFGRKGVVVNFVKSDEIEILRDIEQHYSTEICEMPANFADYI